MNYEEVSEDMTLKGLMLVHDKNQVRSLLDEQYSNYDCELIYKKLKSYKINRELQYVMSTYDYNFQQGVDYLVDNGILKLW